jgi:hypothetical protein
MKFQRKESHIDRLVRERWNLEETLTILKAACRKLLRSRASLDRIRAVAAELRGTLQIKAQLEKQLTEAHCTVQFFYAL